MLLKCRRVMDGPGPSEVVVAITVDGGIEELMVQESSLKNSALEVGSIVGRNNGLSLIELPRETASGKWRVWVPNDQVLQTV